MGRTTATSYPRSKGGRNGATPAVFEHIIRGQVTLPAATAEALTTTSGSPVVLPKGAIVTAVSGFGEGTGGTTPKVNIGSGIDDAGTAADADGFAVDLDADTADSRQANGALINTVLAANTPVEVTENATTPATGGVLTVLIHYIPEDDGALQG